jgi:hypothetical protein
LSRGTNRGKKNKLNDRYSIGDGVLGIFFNFKGTPSWILHKALRCQLSQKLLEFYANFRRCCKSHAAPFDLLFYNISANMNGATESLAPFK